MKKVLASLLAAIMIASALVLSASAAYLSTPEVASNFDIYITEVCIAPTGHLNDGFGQLIEIYNNTDGALDLYDYEIQFTSGRAIAKQFKAAEQFKGLLIPAKEQNKCVLQSGELAVIWIPYNESQAAFTEASMREEMKKLGMELPMSLQVFRVDATDPTVFVAGTENHVTTDTRYIMINHRGCYELNKEKELSAYADGDGTLRGAYIRSYGLENGLSQLFALPKEAGTLNWQGDGAVAKFYETPSFGRLTDSDNIKQSTQFLGAIEFGTAAPTEAPTAAPTAAPTEAPTAAPTEAPTAAPTEAPTDAPTEAPTDAPATDAPTAAPETKPAEEKKGCKSSVACGLVILAVLGTAYVSKKH